MTFNLTLNDFIEVNSDDPRNTRWLRRIPSLAVYDEDILEGYSHMAIPKLVPCWELWRCCGQGTNIKIILESFSPITGSVCARYDTTVFLIGALL